MRFAEFQTQFHRGTTVNVRIPFPAAELPLFRFRVPPVKRQSRHIEQPGEAAFVFGIQFFTGKFAQHEKIGAEFEITAFLCNSYRRTRNRIVRGVFQPDPAPRFPAGVNSLTDPVFHVVLFIQKRLENGFSISVHRFFLNQYGCQDSQFGCVFEWAGVPPST